MTLAMLGVAGAGAMGTGIAQIALTAGLQVTLFDANPEALTKAKTEISMRIARAAKKMD